MLWHGLFKHLCDSNHEISQMQQEEKEQHESRNSLHVDGNIKISKNSGLAN